MGQAERIHEDAVVAGQATAKYRSRGVPSDWYVDPADPDAAERYNLDTHRRHCRTRPPPSWQQHEALLGGSPEPGRTTSVIRRWNCGPPVRAPWRSRSGSGLPCQQDFDDEGELGWQTDALCAQTDPEAFFPEKGGSTRDAKKVCGACNVRSQCLEYALANDERFGIWGGLSERERRRLRKRAV